MDLSMTKEKSDSLLKAGIISVTSDAVSDHSNCVRFTNEGGWGKLADRRTGNYEWN